MPKKKFIFVLSMAIGSLCASLAQAHAKIDVAQPKADSELNAAPKEIRLHFTDTLEPAFSKIVLLDAKNAAVKLPKTVVGKADGKTMSAQLPMLGPGQYQVRWTIMTRDSHKVKGDYRFTVK